MPNPNTFVQTILLEYMNEHSIDPSSDEGKLFLTSLGLLQTTSVGSSPIQTATVTLSAVQLKSLAGTPVQAIAAPGVGKFITVLAATMQYNFGTVAYVVGGGSEFQLCLSAGIAGNRLGPVFLTNANIFDQLESQIWSFVQQNGGDTRTNVENQPLMVTAAGSPEMTTGDGTAVVTVYYTVVTLQ